MSASLRATDVHKHVTTATGPVQILEGVDLQIEPGEAAAILGASGSGKTTLLGLLAGLDLPSRGTIEVANTELTDLDDDARAQLRARLMGFVFQSFQLLDDLNALENVALPLELFGHDAPQATARRWLGQLGLDDRHDHRPGQLSGGEQQRVALARAFAPDPDVLFADEPTANLDRTTAQGVIEQMFELRAEHGTTLVLVTHDEALARRCDRVFHLRAGRLIDAHSH